MPRWVKGQSGNPKGRKTAMVERTAKEQAIKHARLAFKTFVDVLKDENAPHSAKVSAANGILDRAYGKAPQDVTVKGQIEQHIIQLIQGLDVIAEQQEQADSKPENVTEH